jgi:RNA polymerase sigma-70 factor (ECF subfamily)
VDREGPAIVAACARILGDRAEAEDVAQEAFVIAYRSLGAWRADGAFGAWLSRIAVRLAIRRSQARRQVTWLDPLAAEADQPGQERFRTMGSGDAVDPATTMLRSERDAAVRAAVASLDEPYREVVALRFFAERSLAEIAEATDRPLGTVKTHLHRGLARLRRALEEADR